MYQEKDLPLKIQDKTANNKVRNYKLSQYIYYQIDIIRSLNPTIRNEKTVLKIGVFTNSDQQCLKPC